jgi:hypothetical protein
MNVALDIDGTITRMPEFFAFLSHAVRAAGGKVYVVTSRAVDAAVQTRHELQSYGIELDELFIIPEGTNRIPCPHAGLDWYQRHLWQKVFACLQRDVHVVFEDDPKVVALFKAHAPKVQVFHVM